MKLFKSLVVLAALCLPIAAHAQILPSGAQQVQGTEAPNRGYPVSTLLVDASGNSLATSTGINVVEVPSAASTAGVTSVQSTVATASTVIKASAGNLYGFNVVSGASAGFILVYNATSAPADGTVTPIKCLPIAANTGIDVNMRGQPTYFSTGIVIAFSTTGCFTQTLSATAFISGDAR